MYASADYLNVDLLLKPAKLADYTIVFASGRMVLAYLATDPKARALPVAGDFNPPASIPAVAANWYQHLLAPGVRIAGAHPFLDPGGYRAHLIFELAQTYYKAPDLYNALLEHYTVMPADSTNPAAAPALGRDYNFQITYEHGAATVAKNNPSYRYARCPIASISQTPIQQRLRAGKRHDSRAWADWREDVGDHFRQPSGLGAHDPEEQPESGARRRLRQHAARPGRHGCAQSERTDAADPGYRQPRRPSAPAEVAAVVCRREISRTMRTHAPFAVRR